MIKHLQDINVESLQELMSPEQVKMKLPVQDKSTETVFESREVIKNIISQQDSRLLVIAGPCSIHNVEAALEYAQKLRKLKDKVQGKIYLVMRVYFEKTTDNYWLERVN